MNSNLSPQQEIHSLQREVKTLQTELFNLQRKLRILIEDFDSVTNEKENYLNRLNTYKKQSYNLSDTNLGKEVRSLCVKFKRYINEYQIYLRDEVETKIKKCFLKENISK